MNIFGNTAITLIFIIFIAFIILLCAFQFYNHQDQKHVNEMQAESERLDVLITARKGILNNLETQIENMAHDRNYNLSRATMEVLDMYEHSRICIPVEIIEELAHKHLGDKDKIIEYIENQRHMWKLENSKKLLRMDVTI